MNKVYCCILESGEKIMATSCRDLLELDVFHQIPLIAGEAGINRKITWPYVVTTYDIAEWLHGGELLFITGIGININDESLIALLMECISNEIAGIVILTGGPYIKTIPESMCKIANEKAFPLFEMPWEIKLIDITQTIVNLIMNQKEKLKKSEMFLEKLLFSNEVKNSSLDELTSMYGFRNRTYKFIAVISISEEDKSPSISEYIENDLMNTLSGLSLENKLDLITMSYAGKVVCLALADTLKYTQIADKYITSTLQMSQARYPDTSINIGIGRVYKNATQILKSFNEAIKVLSFSHKLDRGEIVNYKDLGIYRMFFAIKDTTELRAYSEDNIGDIITHDLQNKSFLLLTLKEFLLNNGNLVKTAQALYIHRNTLLYRLNSIKDIIQRDLDDGMVRMELFNSIMVYEYLFKEV